MFLFQIMYTVFSATAGVFLIGSFGAYLTHKKTITKQLTANFSKLVEQLFLPALIFTNFLKSITLQKLIILIPSVVTTITCLIVGYIVGTLANKIWIKEKRLNSIIQLATANPHTTTIQLQLSFSLSKFLAKITNEKEQDVEAKLITIIILQTTINNFFRWSIGKKILQQHENDQTNEIELHDLKTQVLIENNKIENNCVKQQEQNSGFWNPPLVSVVISLLCIIIYPIQNALIDETFLHFALYLPLVTVSRPYSPTVLLMLGSSLYFIATDQKENHENQITILKIVSCRLILLPLFGLILVYVMVYLQIMNDFCSLFILFITFCTPSAINLLVMTKQYQQQAEQIVSLLLLNGYILCVVTLPIWMTIYIMLYLNQ